jgi:hypothetical protein
MTTMRPLRTEKKTTCLRLYNFMASSRDLWEALETPVRLPELPLFITSIAETGRKLKGTLGDREKGIKAQGKSIYFF